MIFRGIVLTAALLLAGCATLPDTPTTRGLELNKLVDAIQCELASVYRDAPATYSAELDQFVSKAELELRILNSVNASAEATIIIPTASVITTFSPSAGVDSTAGRISNLKFNMVMKALRQHHCARRQPAVADTSVEQAPHNLGLTNWLIAAISATQRPDQASLSTMSYAAEFVVTPGAKGTLGFDVVNWTPKGGTGISSKDTQTLNISFARIGGPDIMHVNIENWPTFELKAPSGGQQGGPPSSGVTVLQSRAPRPASSGRTFNPATEYRLDRELLQNRTPTIFGIPRVPIGY